MIRAYDRYAHAHDRVVWTSILKGQAVSSEDCWGQQELVSSVIYREFLQPHGLRYCVSIPLAAPVIEGYPGAVVIYRGPDEGDFTPAEMAKLKDIGRKVDEVVAASRAVKVQDIANFSDPWMHKVSQRVFVYGKDSKIIYPRKGSGLPSKIEMRLAAEVKSGLDAAAKGNMYCQRVLVPDDRGDAWVFRVESYEEYPALSSTPVVFVTLQPEAHEWVIVKPWEVAADAELARMLPSMKFMQDEFAACPSLGDIAVKSHLSPFHFHRRFTDLVGQTPKHFLVACQMHEAKRMLASRKKTLPEIAKDCGFSHQSHFTSRFRQSVGLTPTRWRRMAALLLMSQSKE